MRSASCALMIALACLTTRTGADRPEASSPMPAPASLQSASPQSAADTADKQTPAGTIYKAYQLEHQLAARLEPVLRELLTPWQQRAQMIIDGPSNQILLQGPVEAHQVLSQLLDQADCPSAEQPTEKIPKTNGQHILKSYPLPADGTAQQTVASLRQTFSVRTDVRIALDDQSKLLFVLASPAIQSQIASQIRRLQDDSNPTDHQTPDPGRPAAPTGQQPTPLPNPSPHAGQQALQPSAVLPESQFVWLTGQGVDHVSQRLQQLLGDRLQRLHQIPATTTAFVCQTGPNERLTIVFDPNRQGVTVTGNRGNTRQIARLLSLLDRSPEDGNMRILRVRKSTAPILNQEIDRPPTERPQDKTSPPRGAGDSGEGGSGEGTEQPAPSGSAPSSSAQSNANSPGSDPRRATQLPSDTRRAQWIDRLFSQNDSSRTPSGSLPAGILPAAFFPDEESSEATHGANATRHRNRSETLATDRVGSPSESKETGLSAASGTLFRQLGLDVEIEVLPEWDVLILRGRDDEVDRVAEIIKEIERVAEQTKPQLEIVPLEHVRSGAITTMITSVRESLLQGRQGRVSVISLETPNALLLIGWGGALDVVKGLIEKLDVPVAPSTQMQIFHLRHANATQAQLIIQKFFANQTGLSPMVQVANDPRTNSLIVHAAPRDLKIVARMVKELDVSDSASTEQVEIIQLKHTLAADLAQTIQSTTAAARGSGSGKSATLELLTIDAEGKRIVESGILDDVRITPDKQTNSLIITAPAENLELIKALIQQLDQPTSTAQIKVFRITNGDANSLVLMLRSILPTQTGSTTRPQLAGAEGESSLAPLRFTVEHRTNSIIASGTTGDLRIVEALLIRLDENDIQRRSNRIYRLKNAPAVDVSQAINDFLRNKRRIEQSAPGEASRYQQIDKEVIVVPEPISNTLIVSATPRHYEEIIELIDDLDEQPPQVMIQVLIAEVALGNTDEFGVELGLQDSVLFDRSLVGDLITTTNSSALSTPAGVVTTTDEVVQSASNIPGFLFNDTSPLGNSLSDRSAAGSSIVGTQGISNFAVGRLNQELGFGGLVLSASSESVSLMIRALQEDERLEILSRPQIVTMDNQAAFIQVGQRVPRVVQSQLSTFGQINSVELTDVGLILGVTPRINSEGMVVMEIDAEKSEVGPEAEGIPIATSNEGTIIRSPKIDITSAMTTVSAADGETIVLGGLIVKRTKDLHRRVPLLADIPLLGDLFRYDMHQTQRAELLIILTPHVIRNAQDMERLKQTETARISWCAADVHALHGGDGLCHDLGCPVCRTEVPIIYPDDNPRGKIKLETDQGPLDSLRLAAMAPEATSGEQVALADPTDSPSAAPLQPLDSTLSGQAPNPKDAIGKETPVAEKRSWNWRNWFK